MLLFHGDRFGHLDGFVDVAAEVFSSDLFRKPAVLHYLHGLGIDVGEHDLRPLGDAAVIQLLQRGQSRGIQRRYAPHAQHQRLRLLFRRDLGQFFDAAEEQRSLDLVDAHLGQDAAKTGFLVLGRVFQLADVRLLAHALHEEQAGKTQSHGDRDDEVEHDGEDERDDENDDIALRRRLHHADKGPPLAHVVCDDEQHRRDDGHGDEGRVRH